MVRIHTEKTIAASHQLPNYEGPCANLHGHNIRVIVDVWGEVDPRTHMVADFRDIKEIINEYDHKHLNDFNFYPTAEEFAQLLARRIYEKLSEKYYYIEKVKVRVYESEDSFAEFTTYFLDIEKEAENEKVASGTDDD